MSSLFRRALDGRLFEATIDYDDWADPPYHDGACPIFVVTGRHVERVELASSYPRQIDQIEEALETFVGRHGARGGISFFERYVAAFHDGEIVTDRRDDDCFYVAVATQELWESWGNTGPMPLDVAEMDEYMAYVRGEVYYVAIREYSQHCNCPDCIDLGRYHDLDAVGSLFSHTYAEEEAERILDELVAEYNFKLKGTPWDSSPT